MICISQFIVQTNATSCDALATTINFWVLVRFAGSYRAESLVYHTVRRVGMNGVEQEKRSKQLVLSLTVNV